MTAIEEHTAEESGKSIHGELSVDGATRATLPQLRYGDAVYAALAQVEFHPDALEAGMRREPGGGRELFLRLEWLPGHDDLVPVDVLAGGLTVEWSHLIGWLVRAGNDLVVPTTAAIAAPQVVADLAMHAALHGIRCTCEKPDGEARWGDAVYLDIALVAYDERVPGVAG